MNILKIRLLAYKVKKIKKGKLVRDKHNSTNNHKNKIKKKKLNQNKRNNNSKKL